MAYLYVNSNGKEVRSHSYSAGSLFHECAQKYKLSRLDGWKEREQRASQQFGIALESAIKTYHELDLEEALKDFRNLWGAQRGQDLKYTATEQNWDALAKSGEEMIRLYDLRLPLFPIDPKNVKFQIKYYKELFPGDTNLSGIEFVAYIDMVTRSRAALGDSMIVDIKTSGKAFDSTPGMLSLDQQLRSYAWVTGVPDVAFLNFIKTGRSIDRGDQVSVLENIQDGLKSFFAGESAFVAAYEEDELAPPLVYLLKHESDLDAMKDAQGYKNGKLEQTKAAKERKIAFLADNCVRADARLVTKQKIQFVNAHIGLEEQLEAAKIIGHDVSKIVYANQENFWPKEGGIRFPNDKCVRCQFRGNCLQNSQLRDNLVYRTDEEWDAPQADSEEN